MTATTVNWRHYSGLTDATGMMWVSTGNGVGTHVETWGGYAAPLVNANDLSTDETGADANGATPLAGSYPSYDSGNDTDYVILGFAAPPGVHLRCHIFWTERP